MREAKRIAGARASRIGYQGGSQGGWVAPLAATRAPVEPRKERDGFDLISDRLRRGPIWYAGPDAVRNAASFAKYCSRSRSRWAIIRVFNESGNVTEAHER
jgi:hypothetical protein